MMTQNILKKCNNMRPVINSKLVQKGDVFIAVKGYSLDGNKYIAEAIRKGASAILTDQKLSLSCDTPIYRVKDARTAALDLSEIYYKYPSKKLKLIGITGTNGKTTTSYLIYQILLSARKKTILIGTIANYICGKKVVSTNTTPDAILTSSLLKKGIDRGAKYAVMEASSHAIDQKRIHRDMFNVKIFTNLSSEHLDYHRTMEEYFKVKASFFKGGGDLHIINGDDPYGRRIFSQINSGKKLLYGIQSKYVDIRAINIIVDHQGMEFDIAHGSKLIHIKSRLIGEFNIYNILAAYTCAKFYRIPAKLIQKGISNTRVPGRMEKIPHKTKSIYIDYAHTEDALENILLSLSHIQKKKLIVVFGCGGNRDKRKRSKMMRVAKKYADYVIITDDNPRFENPEVIVDDILKGRGSFDKYHVVHDRKKAIKKALQKAHAGDMIVIAGKGHESGQYVKGKIYPMNDKEIVEGIIR